MVEKFGLAARHDKIAQLFRTTVSDNARFTLTTILPDLYRGGRGGTWSNGDRKRAWMNRDMNRDGRGNRHKFWRPKISQQLSRFPVIS